MSKYKPFPSPTEMVAHTLKKWEREFEAKRFDELLKALRAGIALYEWEQKNVSITEGEKTWQNTRRK